MRKRKHRFTDYDYEEVFKDPLELASEKTIERLLQLGKMKSVYATKDRVLNSFDFLIYPQDHTKPDFIGLFFLLHCQVIKLYVACVACVARFCYNSSR